MRYICAWWWYGVSVQQQQLFLQIKITKGQCIYHREPRDTLGTRKRCAKLLRLRHRYSIRSHHKVNGLRLKHKQPAIGRVSPSQRLRHRHSNHRYSNHRYSNSNILSNIKHQRSNTGTEHCRCIWLHWYWLSIVRVCSVFESLFQYRKNHPRKYEPQDALRSST